MRIILKIPDQLGSLLGNPGRVKVLRASCQVDAPGSQFDEEQHIDGLGPDRFPGEEITSYELDWPGNPLLSIPTILPEL